MSPHPPTTTPDGAHDPHDAQIETLLRIIEEETVAVSAALSEATARQWEPSLVPKPREDTTERSSGGRPANPTADAALDPHRLRLRATVVRSTAALREAAIALRGSRRAMERALAAYDGEPLP